MARARTSSTGRSVQRYRTAGGAADQAQAEKPRNCRLPTVSHGWSTAGGQSDGAAGSVDWWNACGGLRRCFQPLLRRKVALRWQQRLEMAGHPVLGRRFGVAAQELERRYRRESRVLHCSPRRNDRHSSAATSLLLSAEGERQCRRDCGRSLQRKGQHGPRDSWPARSAPTERDCRSTPRCRLGTTHQSKRAHGAISEEGGEGVRCEYRVAHAD